MFRPRRPRLLHPIRRTTVLRQHRAFRPLLEVLEDRTVPSYTIHEFALPNPNSGPTYIQPGPDGNVWFMEDSRHALAKITPAGQITEVPLPPLDTQWPYADFDAVDPDNRPAAFVFGPDGNIWITKNDTWEVTQQGQFLFSFDAGKYNIALASGYIWTALDSGTAIARTTSVGNINEQEFSLPVGVSETTWTRMTVGPDGNMWMSPVQNDAGQFGVLRFSIDGTSQQFFPIPNPGPDGVHLSPAYGLTTGPDGNLWAAQINALGSGPSWLLRITTDGQITKFDVPSWTNTGSGLVQMTAGSDGALWVAENFDNHTGRIARIAMDGTVTEIPIGGIQAKYITAGPDGNIWFTEFDSNQIGEVVLNHPSTLQGFVYEDFNNDGQIDFGENGISGVSIRLQGTDVVGNTIDQTVTTDTSGSYQFSGIFQGNYTITETQPAGYNQGTNTIGSVIGVATGSISGADQFFVNLGNGVDGFNYNFGERPVSGGTVHSGQTAGIGFWNNNHGQALIKALNGGQNATELGNWLAATFVNIFGDNAGSNDLAGLTNAQVATAFQQKFMLHGPKLDAQVMATALSVYVTNNVLAGNVAAAYGFTVTHDGAGVATINIGSDGAAVGHANGTTMSIMDILLALDSLSAGDHGILYGGNTIQRNAANDLFSRINQSGGI